MEEQAWRLAGNQRGPWWNAGASHMHAAFPKSWFERMGLVSLLDTLQPPARFMNRRMRNRSSGDVGGRRGWPRLLADSSFPGSGRVPGRPGMKA
jgi:hypothetical protein